MVRDNISFTLVAWLLENRKHPTVELTYQNKTIHIGGESQELLLIILRDFPIGVRVADVVHVPMPRIRDLHVDLFGGMFFFRFVGVENPDLNGSGSVRLIMLVKGVKRVRLRVQSKSFHAVDLDRSGRICGVVEIHGSRVPLKIGGCDNGYDKPRTDEKGSGKVILRNWIVKQEKRT